MSSAAEPPNFFKVFLPECSSKRLQLPNVFVALTRLKEMAPEEFILRNGRGRGWKVKTSSIGTKVFFEDGWERFVGDHALQLGDFIVFHYDGSNLIKFKIYEGSSRCENPELEMDEDEDEGYDDDDDDDKDYDEGSGDDEHTVTYHPRVISKEGTAGSSGSKADDLGECETVALKYFSHPDNPYFIAKQYKRRKNELPIPCSIIKDLSLVLPETITLRCQYISFSSLEQTIRESRYPDDTGKIHTWKDGRVCIKGWSSFCRKNKIEENDACICEIVLREDLKVERLQVHVVRPQV